MTYRKIPKISPGAYFWRGLSTEGNLGFKIDWASLIVGMKFTVFSLFCFVFEPRRGLYSEGRFNGGFFALRVWGAYIWRGLFSEFYGRLFSKKFLFHPSTQLPQFKPMVLQISTLDSVLSHRSVDGEPIFADALTKIRIRIVVGVLFAVLKGTQKSILPSPFQWQREFFFLLRFGIILIKI